jgi:hypothetical protein
MLHTDSKWLHDARINTEGMTEKQVIDTYDAIQSAIKSGRHSVKVEDALYILGMIGAGGAQFTNKTVWEGKAGDHIDVENPAPGKRPGQIHYQVEPSGEKFQFNFEKGEFDGLSNTQNRNLLENPDVQRGIQRGTQYLGIGEPEVNEL